MMTRRSTIKLLGAAGVAVLPGFSLLSKLEMENMITRRIPVTGEELPIIGLGTWIQFDVGSSESERAPLKEVLQKMIEKGGRVIDSSPMYGKSEGVVGDLTYQMKSRDKFFYATKVWTSGENAGIRQMESSMQKMRRSTLDLMQVHNLVDWKTHLKTLRKWKEEGKIRYIGLTHYTDSSHSEIERIIKSEQIDFIQFNYSIAGTNAERSLLPAAADLGVATIINRPYEGGNLFSQTRNKSLPAWAKEYSIESWGQFFLKYIVSHPAVTCVIPGTSKPHHLIDNMGAGYGELPEEATRIKMKQFIAGL